jgi:hypothetical protein
MIKQRKEIIKEKKKEKNYFLFGLVYNAFDINATGIGHIKKPPFFFE